MRYLFFLALLANVSYFVWEWRTNALKPVAANLEEVTYYEHDILLVSEFEALQPDTQQALQQASINDKEIKPKKLLQPSKSSMENLICFNFGPFEDKTEILQWAEQNNLKAEDISFHLKDVEVITGYLLFYPPADSLIKAQENVVILEAKGVENLWLYKFGDMKGAISLGFFNTEAQAKESQMALKKIGVDSSIKTHSKVKAHTFATITWKNNAGVSQIIASYKEKFPEQQVLQLTECLITKSKELVE